MDNFFSGMLHIILSPFVNSKIPEIKPEENFSGICKKWKMGFKQLVKMSINWLVCNIEIITENKTTKPPIIRIVEIADWMLVPSISPKFETVIFWSLLSYLETLYFLKVTEFFFQNLNKIPTVIHPKICVIKSKIPIR